MNKLKLAAALYLVNDYITRRDNYDDMICRLEENIDRWNTNIKNIERAKQRVEDNIGANKEKLEKAKTFLKNLESEKSTIWYRKQKFLSTTHASEQIRASATQHVHDYDNKLESVRAQISRLESWMQQGYERISSMNSSISDIKNRIRSTRKRID